MLQPEKPLVELTRLALCGTPSGMKSKILLSVLLLTSLVLFASCKSLLVATPSPTSLPVTMGLVDTNQPNVVAYLEAARKLNAVANPTPYAPAIDGILAGAAALTGAFAGWYARHTTAKATELATRTANDATVTKVIAATNGNFAPPV